MENKIKNIDLIPNLSENSRRKIEELNSNLAIRAGAVFSIDEVTYWSVKIAVRNINGKRASKYELLQHAYKAFSENLPENYRIQIKL